MTISVTGTSARGPSIYTRATAAGFTLLELLVVILIIGIALSLVVIRIGGDQIEDELEREGLRLQRLIVLASEEAVLQSQELGLQFQSDGYQFLVYQGDGWLPIAGDAIFRQREMPPGVELELELEGRSVILDGSEDKPQIMILSSGELSPFKLDLHAADAPLKYQLVGHFSGNIENRLIEAPH